MNHEFQIFVSTYANTTRGEWLNPLDDDFDDRCNAISDNGRNEILAADCEGFGSLSSESVTLLAGVAQFASRQYEPAAFVAYLAYVGGDAEDVADDFADAYAGEWDDEEAYAQHIADETLEIPASLAPYFDTEKFARDLFISDYFSVDAPRGVYVFRHV